MSAEDVRRAQRRHAAIKQIFRNPDAPIKESVVQALVFVHLGDQLGVKYDVSMYPEAKCPRCGLKFGSQPVINAINDVFGGGWVHETCVIK